MRVVTLADESGYADFATLVARARAADPDGAMRLQVTGTTLAAYAGVLPGGGLLAGGAVVGLRVMTVLPGPDLDATVALSALADRFARQPRGVALQVPAATTSPAWAAVSPPRTGWEPVGHLPAAELERAARDGITEIASATTPSAGAAAVAALRQRVWGRLTATTPPVLAGAAFAAYVLGFIETGQECRVLANGRWTRLSTARGHVLSR